MTRVINQHEAVKATGIALDRNRITEAKMAVVICFAWVILAPFAIWFGIAHIQNFWLSLAPLIFGCVAVIPLLGSYSVVVELRDALQGRPTGD